MNYQSVAKNEFAKLIKEKRPSMHTPIVTKQKRRKSLIFFFFPQKEPKFFFFRKITKPRIFIMKKSQKKSQSHAEALYLCTYVHMYIQINWHLLSKPTNKQINIKCL